MNTNWKTVRVFISSTFRDMQAERDWLVRFVFPRLREYLLLYRIHLVDADLRWGVTSEQDALDVCREIIDICRPHFLCILGGRYGWVPPGSTRSITDEEIHYGVLDQIGNRSFANFYFRDETATAAMVEITPGEFRERPGSDTEKKLIELKEAIIAAGPSPFKYPAEWDAASNRLIGLKEFGDHVYSNLLANIRADSNLQDHFRTDPMMQADEFAEEDAAMETFVEERLEHFMIGSRQALLDELLAHADETGGNGYVCLTGAPGSGKSSLLAHLSRHPTINSQPSTLLIRHFVGVTPGSTDVRRTVRRLCHALKAACPDITTDIPDDPEKLRAAFRNFLQQACVNKRVVILLDAVNQFDLPSYSARLNWLPEDLPTNARIILSLQSNTGTEVRDPAVTRSEAIDATEGVVTNSVLEELHRRRIPPKELELKPLTADDGDAIIDQFLERYHKTMTDEQRIALLTKSDAGTPLYLLVALEELRTLGIYEEITWRIIELPSTTPELFSWILTRLENDEGFRDSLGQRIGHVLIPRFAALLSASHYGLSQRELADLLDAGDPQGNVAALLHLLRPYLMHHGELLDFYHSQFRAAAQEVWLKTDAQRAAAHTQLAEYFRTQADAGKDQSWQGESRRPFLELPFHLARSDADQLTQLLFDFNFLQAKTAKGCVNELVQDYEDALHVLPACHLQRRALELVQGGFRLSAHVISQDWNQLVSQLVGRILWFKEAHVMQLVEAAISWQRAPWLQSIVPSLNLPGGPLLRTFNENPTWISAVAALPDGRRVVSASGDGILTVWDITTGQRLHTVVAHKDRNIYAVAVLPGICGIVSAAADGTLKVWDMETMREVRSIHVDSYAVQAVAGLPDGRQAISAAANGTMKIWNLETGQEVKTLQGHRYSVVALSVFPDGNRAVSAADFDNTLKIWDLNTGRELFTLSGHSDKIFAVATLPDNRRVVSTSLDGTLRIWNVESGEEPHTFMIHSGLGHGLAAFPDARRVILSYRDDALAIWDLEAGQELNVLHGHTDWVSGIALLSHGQLAVSVSGDRTVKLWDLSVVAETPTHQGHSGEVTALEVTPNGQWTVSASYDRVVKVWDTATGKEVRSLKGHSSRVNSLSITPDSLRVVSASGGPFEWDNTLKVWDLDTGLNLHTLRGHENWVKEVRALPDGRRAVSAGYDGTLRVWDLHTGQEIHTLRGHSEAIYDLSVLPDGCHAISASQDKTLKVWDLNQGVLLHTLTGHSQSIGAVVALPDACRALSAAADNTLKVWDLVSGRELATLNTGYSYQLSALSVALDGRRAVTLSYDGVLVIWDIERYQALRTVRGHVYSANTVKVLPCGKRFVSSGGRGSVKVWDLETGTCLATFTGEGEFQRCAVTPSGQIIVMGERSGGIHFLRLGNL